MVCKAQYFWTSTGKDDTKDYSNNFMQLFPMDFELFQLYQNFILWSQQSTMVCKENSISEQEHPQLSQPPSGRSTGGR